MSEISTGPVVVQTAESATNTNAQENTQTPETAKPEGKQDFLAPKFAALTRKEKQIRAAEQAMKQKEAEIAKREAELSEKFKSSEQTESQLLAEMKKNPLKFMEKHGLTFDELTQMQLNDQNPTPEMQMQRMRDEIRSELMAEIGGVKETLKQKEEREAKEAYEAAVSSYKNEINQFVQSNAETYELIATNNATDLMFEVAEAFFNQTGKIPDIQEVAKEVEQHLEQEAKKILGLKKFQTSKKPEANPEPKEGSKTAPTLSNTLAAEVPKSSTKLLSDEESKREAAKMLRWNS